MWSPGRNELVHYWTVGGKYDTDDEWLAVLPAWRHASVVLAIDVKNVQVKFKKRLKNFKNVTKIKKNVCKRNKNVTSS